MEKYNLIVKAHIASRGWLTYIRGAKYEGIWESESDWEKERDNEKDRKRDRETETEKDERDRCEETSAVARWSSSLSRTGSSCLLLTKHNRSITHPTDFYGTLIANKGHSYNNITVFLSDLFESSSWSMQESDEAVIVFVRILFQAKSAL